MIRSLHARLLAGVLALTFVGMLVMGGVIYGEQRSFLMERLDDQVAAAVQPVTMRLESEGVLERPLGGPPGPGPRGGGFGGRGPRRGGRPGRLGEGPPHGTYGEVRDPSGEVLGSTTLTVDGTTENAKPELPDAIQPGRLITIKDQSGAGTRYRVLARPTFGDAGRVVVVAVPMREVDENLERLLLVEALVIACVLLAMGILAWLVVRAGLRPLDRVEQAAVAIAGGDLSHRVEETDPRTEVGRLGAAFNNMLDRLQEAFAKQRASEDRLRTFLADASHELRTPLASIRGYAELFRIGAASSPEDTQKAMRRIEEESRRMGVLVEDLLTLARQDEIAATHLNVDPTEVDLARLAADAVQDARAIAPDREIRCETNGTACVLGDEDQLRQVLGNLVRNALVHTPGGTGIDVSVQDGDEVSLAVRDHGPGLPPDVEPGALFERFWRAEGGRERGRAGSGLGLAIVAAIVNAHGGRVEAQDAPGGGAQFIVRLPAA